MSESESSIEDDMSAQGSYGEEFPIPEHFKSSKQKEKKAKSQKGSGIVIFARSPRR